MVDQGEYYSRTRRPRYEAALRDPKALVGVSLPIPYSKPHRLLLAKLQSLSHGDFRTMRLLDLGCGEGSWACYLAGLGVDVTALDISSVNVDFVRLRAERNGLTTIKSLVGDCAQTGLASGSFNVVLGVALIHHLEVERERALYREVHRLLVPGGTALFCESLNNCRVFDFLISLVPVRQKHNPRPSRLSPKWKEHVLNNPHPVRPNTTRHYMEMLRDAGFQKVEVEELGILSRCDRLTTNARLRKWIHDVDYRMGRFLPFRGALSRNIVIRLQKE